MQSPANRILNIKLRNIEALYPLKNGAMHEFLIKFGQIPFFVGRDKFADFSIRMINKINRPSKVCSYFINSCSIVVLFDV